MTTFLYPAEGTGLDPGSARRLLGGKALGLHRLKELGLPIPDWVTLTSEAFAATATALGLTQILRAPLDTTRAARQAQEKLLGAELPVTVQEALDAAWDALQDRAPLAVRSSALEEDAAEASFAGQNETFLNVSDRAGLERAVKGCWASLFGNRSVAYRTQMGLPLASATMAVVIQVMVSPDASGVLFTTDPVSGRSDRTVVSALWGLGEGLVSGRLDADTYTLGPEAQLLEQRIARKVSHHVRNETGGVACVPVREELIDAPSLTLRQLEHLHKYGRTVAQAWGCPMDVEFCVQGALLYLLQARPITALAPHQHLLVWDNANIVESYSGITLPLTFSFIRLAYRGVYVQFAELLGLTQAELRRREELFWNMLGLIEGRVYYNLLNWYRLVALMPGFQANRRFMEQMMGLKVSVDDLEQAQRGWGSGVWRLLRAGARMLWLHATLPGRIRAFHRRFGEIHQDFASKNHAKLQPWEVLADFDALKARLLWQWKAPIVNDFEAMIFYGLLKRLTVAWFDPGGALQNALLCGEGGIESTQVITGLRAMAEKIAQDPARQAVFLEASPDEALRRVRDDPAWSDVNAELERYLEAYGVRCVQEMKLESIPMRENPAFCMALVRNYLSTRSTARLGTSSAADIRTEAEEELRRRLAWRLTKWGLPKRTLYRWVLRNARAAVKNRENQRLARAQTYAIVRSMFRSIGSRWAVQGLIEEARDIFYLELDEIRSFIDGTATCTNLKGLVALRKQEYQGYAERTPDDHIETRGVVYAGNTFRHTSVAADSQAVLEGLGACQGVVEGTARVVFLPDADLRLSGEILVARETDPGWTVLFPSISGLVVEKGSMLSHSAIVAREMGIPAVVGVREATSRIRDGQRVRLDGAAGKVYLLD
jgi:pyruvate,water dikinase